MKFFFLKRGNEKLGSNRIYISNLCKWVAKLKYTTHCSTKIESGYDIYILSKYASINDLKYIKKINNGKKILCGIIHPSDLTFSGRQLIKNCDFAIVGSIEEKDYYKQYVNNIFRFPQIEDLNKIVKRHTHKNFINIGYHGNLEHLEEMSSATTKALERIAEKYQIQLTVIYDKKLGKWKKGRPSIKIKEIDWSLSSLVKEISNFDIGIMPCTNNFFLDKPLKKMNFFSKLIKRLTGGRNKRLNDYIIRFKVTSNSGRAFIFHQLGIPVIGDFWPSNFEILGTPDCGFLAHSEENWYSSLESLIKSPNLRNLIAKNAEKEFSKRYDPLIWSRNLIEEISNI